MTTKSRNYLDERINWERTNDPVYPFRATVGDEEWQLRLNDFPDETLYTLLIDNAEVASFDDWPELWEKGSNDRTQLTTPLPEKHHACSAHLPGMLQAQEWNWSEFSSRQVENLAECFLKWEFTVHGFDVSSSQDEVSGIDFMVRKHTGERYYISVKLACESPYIPLVWESHRPRRDVFTALVLFSKGEPPRGFLVRSSASSVLDISSKTPTALGGPSIGDLERLSEFALEKVISKL